VTKRALKLRGVVTFFGHVLPVIELDRLPWRFRLSRSAQQNEPDHRDCNNDQYQGFDRSSHLVLSVCAIAAAAKINLRGAIDRALG
jgi:hypothetical protein